MNVNMSKWLFGI